MNKERSLGIRAAEMSQTIDKVGIVVGAGFVIIGSVNFGIILIGTSVITYAGAEWFKKKSRKQQ